MQIKWFGCHTLRGCVDWNSPGIRAFTAWDVTPYVGVWIETCKIFRKLYIRSVTPYVGVWIETYPLYANILANSSHPTWVCGLKHLIIAGDIDITGHTLRGCVDWNLMQLFSSPIRHVTPYVGVWIETPTCDCFQNHSQVTPYVGVWIETSMAQYSAISKMVTPCVGIYGLEHCSLVGQVYGRTVSIRPLMYFSPGFWFCYDWKKHVQARMLIFCLFFFVVSPRWQYIGT